MKLTNEGGNSCACHFLSAKGYFLEVVGLCYRTVIYGNGNLYCLLRTIPRYNYFLPKWRYAPNHTYNVGHITYWRFRPNTYFEKKTALKNRKKKESCVENKNTLAQQNAFHNLCFNIDLVNILSYNSVNLLKTEYASM